MENKKNPLLASGLSILALATGCGDDDPTTPAEFLTEFQDLLTTACVTAAECEGEEVSEQECRELVEYYYNDVDLPERLSADERACLQSYVEYYRCYNRVLRTCPTGTGDDDLCPAEAARTMELCEGVSDI